jgi:hypothetical protein
VKAVVAYFKILSQHLSGGTEENQENIVVSITVSWPGYEPGTS